MQKKTKTGMLHLLSIILILGVFMIFSLILENVGMQVYKNIVLANNNNFELRTSLSYVATKVRQTDAKKSCYLEEKEGKKVLVLLEDIEGETFETLIYHNNGYLCELVHEKGMDYNFNYGVEIMEINEFEMEETKEGLLHLTARNSSGEEDLMISLRTGGNHYAK